jgi:hypothetical protein
VQDLADDLRQVKHAQADYGRGFPNGNAMTVFRAPARLLPREHGVTPGADAIIAG